MALEEITTHHFEITPMQEWTILDYADFWYYGVGVNPIYVNSIYKNHEDEELRKKFCTLSWTKYQTEELDEETFKQWKDQDKFETGIAIIGGYVWRGKFKGMYLFMGDTDNQLGFDKLHPKGIQFVKDHTLMEQHTDMPHKAHTYFYLDRPIKKKEVSGSEEECGHPAIEVKSDGPNGIHVVAPSIHPSGHRYEIVSNGRSPKIRKADELERHIDEICKEYGISYLSRETQFEYEKTDFQKYTSSDFKIGYNEGRRPALLVVCNHYYWEKQDKLDDSKTFNDVLNLARKWNKEHCSVTLSDDQVEYQNQCAFNNAKKMMINGTMYPLAKKKSKQDEVDVYELAEKLMEEYHFITLEKTNEILFYKNGVYREGGDYIIQKRSRKLVKNVKLNHIREIKGIIQDETGYISRDEFDQDEYIVNLKNGIYDFKNKTFTGHSPDCLSRVQIPIFYDEDVTCPRFDKFLDSSLEGNEEKIHTVWEMFAYCFIKDNTLLCKAFMNTGKGSNGKSILFGIIEACLGKQNMSAKTIHDFERNRFAAAALEGKLANVCADVGSNGISETEMLKKIIAGDLVDCEKKYFDSYTFSPFATLIFSANDIPEIDDESNAFARRFEIIEWTKAFYGDERDHTVKTIRKDPGELSGIFNKICIVAHALLKRQSLKYETTIEDVKKKWRLKSDSAKNFINEEIAQGEDYYVEKVRLFSAYVKFCSQNDMKPLTNQKFNEKMHKEGFIDTTKRLGDRTPKIWECCNLRSDLRGENASIV